MGLIKFELKKIFSNKFFLGMVAFAIFLNVFVLFESGSPTDNIKNEISYKTYDEFIDSVQANAENSLSASIFCDNLTEFSKKNIEKTANDFERMRGIEIVNGKNDGVLLVFNSTVSDLCILLLLITACLSLVADEKDKHLFHLIRSTKNGTVKTFFAKTLSLLVCCVAVNAVITGATASFAYFKYGFGDIHRSIQSVPEMLTAFFRLDIAEFFFMNFAVKTVGIFAVGMLVFLLCLLTKRSISMLVLTSLIGAFSVSLTFIPETSALNFFKYINLYSLMNPYSVFKSYNNLNIFGFPVNANIIFAVFLGLIAGLLITLSAVYFVKKRPLENSVQKSADFSKKYRVYNNVAHFELKKLLSLNKCAAILLVFALLQSYAVYNQENFQSGDEYYYKYYMEMLSGELTPEKENIILTEKAKFTEAEEKVATLEEQRRNGEITLHQFISEYQKYEEVIEKSEQFNRVYNKYLHVKETSGAEFVYDTGYEKLFGISDPNFSAQNNLLLLCVLSFCLCSLYSVDYKNEMYKILTATKYGLKKTRDTKSIIAVCVTAVTVLISYLPEVIFISRFYGFAGAASQLLSIPSFTHFGSLPIWFDVALLYLSRFVIALMMVPIISAISLKTKNNITTALLSLILFAVPFGIYYAFDIMFFRSVSVWNLLSGDVLTGNSSLITYIIQFVILLSLSVASSFFIKHKFGKTEI